MTFETGIAYPRKHIIAVANHLANSEDISTEGFNAVEAKNFLKRLNFVIETRQEEFELIIRADEVISTDEQFTEVSAYKTPKLLTRNARDLLE